MASPATNPRFCSTCGGPLRESAMIYSYSPDTGEPIVYYTRKCPRWFHGYGWGLLSPFAPTPDTTWYSLAPEHR